jgi:hypothetical protein
MLFAPTGREENALTAGKTEGRDFIETPMLPGRSDRRGKERASGMPSSLAGIARCEES